MRIKIRRLQQWIKVFRIFILGTLLLTAVGYFIFYTDEHEVDEDNTAISIYGGRWHHESRAGIARRDMYDSSSSMFDSVASSNM